ncbi:MAG: EamA family transporter [Candidatus Riflebacteria bacterium]|nr:EamA family transporter [Candidatus Riflebacteria bacterium]
MKYLLLTVFFWGITPVFEKIASLSCDPAVGVFIRSMAVAISSTVVVFFMGKGSLILQSSWKTMACLCLSGLLSGCLGFITYLKAMQEISDAGKVAVLAATYPLVALICATIFLKEELTVFKLVGCLLIICGAALLDYKF